MVDFKTIKLWHWIKQWWVHITKTHHMYCLKRLSMSVAFEGKQTRIAIVEGISYMKGECPQVGRYL
jgi:hypothetical protein